MRRFLFILTALLFQKRNKKFYSKLNWNRNSNLMKTSQSFIIFTPLSTDLRVTLHKKMNLNLPYFHRSHRSLLTDDCFSWYVAAMKLNLLVRCISINIDVVNFKEGCFARQKTSRDKYVISVVVYELFTSDVIHQLLYIFGISTLFGSLLRPICYHWKYRLLQIQRLL